MGTPLYSTDIIPITSRPTLTVMDDGDYFVILDTSTGKISKILKTNIMTALKITYDNTSGLTAETVQAALDEVVVNLGSRELLSNKKTTLVENSDVYFPTQKAVNDGLATKTSKSQIAYDNDNTSFIANTLASGAIIERGSNANGRYVKFADGTMICKHVIEFTTVTSSNLGRRSDNVRWDYPAKFSSSDYTSDTTVIGTTPNAPQTYLVLPTGAGASSYTNLVMYVMDASSDYTRIMMLVAIGIWK